VPMLLIVLKICVLCLYLLFFVCQSPNTNEPSRQPRNTKVEPDVPGYLLDSIIHHFLNHFSVSFTPRAW
jgi:hypothetical protein